MKRGSLEWYEAMDFFERSCRARINPKRGSRADIEKFGIAAAYENGDTCELFQSFLNGYEYARSLANVGALPLSA